MKSWPRSIGSSPELASRYRFDGSPGVSELAADATRGRGRYDGIGESESRSAVVTEPAGGSPLSAPMLQIDTRKIPAKGRKLSNLVDLAIATALVSQGGLAKAGAAACQPSRGFGRNASVGSAAEIRLSGAARPGIRLALPTRESRNGCRSSRRKRCLDPTSGSGLSATIGLTIIGPGWNSNLGQLHYMKGRETGHAMPLKRIGRLRPIVG